MKRREFLKLPIAAAALATIGRSAENMASKQGRSEAGFGVKAHQDRSGEELLIMGGTFNLKVSGRDTGGDLCIYDTFREAKGGPALHRHFNQDEWFYVIRGQFVVRVGDNTFAIGPGDSAFAPRRIAHAFAMTGDGPGQMLVLFQPAGSMEAFFREMSEKFGRGIPQGQDAAMRQLWAAHGMEMVGPPLAL
ncbi:MAG TPA: cupin domain-containing protein [Candidatus Didemnitutus sp.]